MKKKILSRKNIFAIFPLYLFGGGSGGKFRIKKNRPIWCMVRFIFKQFKNSWILCRSIVICTAQCILAHA